MSEERRFNMVVVVVHILKMIKDHLYVWSKCIVTTTMTKTFFQCANSGFYSCLLIVLLSVSQKNCHQDWKEEKTKARLFGGGVR